MKSSRFLSSLVLVLASHIPAMAQNTPPPPPPAGQGAGPGPRQPAAVPVVTLTPTQTAHILKELEKVEAQIGQGRGNLFGTALSKFKAAMADDSAAMALYLDCYKLEHFDRRDLKQTDFADWKERNQDRLKEGDMGKALMLQLEYLVLSIQAQSADEVKKLGPLIPALQAYLVKAVGEVQASTKHSASGAVEVKDNGKGNNGGGRRQGGGQGRANGESSVVAATLRQSVKGSEFSRAYQLEDFLTNKNWEYVPLNIGGVYTSTIFPYYAAEKPEELGTQWDNRIAAELALRKAVMSESEYTIFFQEEQPRLLWQKQSGLLASNVNAINALAEMLKIIQANPNHPDAAMWLGTFKTILEKSGAMPPVEKPIGSS